MAPTNTKATLGNVLGELRAAPSHTLNLRVDDKGILDHHAMLVAMLQTVWIGHQDRHGNTTEVDLQQAKNSVYLTATFVVWFAGGCVS